MVSAKGKVGPWVWVTILMWPAEDIQESEHFLFAGATGQLSGTSPSKGPSLGHRTGVGWEHDPSVKNQQAGGNCLTGLN